MTTVRYENKLKNVTVGTLIIVEGVPESRCKMFSINILGNLNDIAFHFNPRLQQRCVARNCRINGYWGDVETTSVARFDFFRDRPFKVSFFVSEREFLVAVNGKHWCAFTHRIPPTAIVGLDVRGDVVFSGCKVDTIETYPEIPLTAESIGAGDYAKRTIKTPYLGNLEQCLKTGWALEIAGKPHPLPHFFFINLQEGYQLWPHPNIPLHLSCKFSTQSGVVVFGRNTWYDGGWFEEEVAQKCPFQAGLEFLIQIRYDPDQFTVWSPSGIQAEFKFTAPTHKINYVYIDGDLELYSVSIHHLKQD